ncbi:MAG: hypothetical protein ACKOC5_06395 [Chloroflexota bacterium]
MKSSIRSLILALVGLALVVSLSSAPHPALAVDDPPANPAGGDHPLYLPLAMKNSPYYTLFGAETGGLSVQRVEQFKELRLSWVRTFAFSWAEIEPQSKTPREYDWSKVDEAGLAAAAANQQLVIAIVKDTPAWARKTPGYICSAPASDKIDEYAAFLKAIVTRYSPGPYGLRYLELGNEVDVDPRLVWPEAPYGCWGDIDNNYYGGGYYAEILRQAYPAIKSANPEVQVLTAGLLLDCDPTNTRVACDAGKYLEGILRAGGGAFFDILSYHAYPRFESPNVIGESVASWNPRGGMYVGKIAFIRAMLSKYGLNKPLMLTEASLVCPEYLSECKQDSPKYGTFLDLQADYVYWTFVRAYVYNIQAVIWYTYEDSGWRSSGLFEDGAAKPAYYAYQYLSNLLYEATYSRTITSYPGVAAYEFRDVGRRLWILWASDQVSHSVTLPTGVIAIYDKFGVQLPTAGAITVKSPVVVVLQP